MACPFPLKLPLIALPRAVWVREPDFGKLVSRLYLVSSSAEETVQDAGRGASDVAFRAGSIEQQMLRMLAAASHPVLTEVSSATVHASFKGTLLPDAMCICVSSALSSFCCELSAYASC